MIANMKGLNLYTLIIAYNARHLHQLRSTYGDLCAARPALPGRNEVEYACASFYCEREEYYSKFPPQSAVWYQRMDALHPNRLLTDNGLFRFAISEEPGMQALLEERYGEEYVTRHTRDVSPDDGYTNYAARQVAT